MSDWIWSNLGTLATLAVLAVFAAPLQDLAAGAWIAYSNWRKGKPTYVVGTVFERVCLPSGQTYHEATIERVDFYRVYLRVPSAPGGHKGALVPIPKRALASMSGHGQLAMAGGQDNLRGHRRG